MAERPIRRDYPALAHYLERHWHKRLHPRPIRSYPFARLRSRLEAMRSPDLAVPAVLLAGTKGKGSTAALLAAVLREHGLHVGLFTSPHLLAVEERVAVDGEPLGPQEFAAAFANASATHPGRAGGAAIYESILLAALDAFRSRGADVAVMEARSGGRYDPLRALRRVIAVGFTPVGRDHIPALGYSLADIAWHKGGLLRPGCPAASALQPAEVTAVLRRLARARGVHLLEEGVDWECVPRARRPQGSRILYRRLHQGQLEAESGIEADLQLLGRFQATNAGLALALASLSLGLDGKQLEPAAAARGLARARWPARMEALRLRPPLVYDGAHTVESAQALHDALRQHFPGLRWRVCLGLTGHRLPEAVLEPLAPLAAEVVAVPVPSVHAVEPAAVVAAARSRGLPARQAASLKGELGGRAVCVTGSLYLYSELPEGLRPSSLSFLARAPLEAQEPP